MLTLTTTEIIIRIAIAVGLASLIGLERTLAGKTAGMRTYAMVAIGSTLFVIISQVIHTVDITFENPLVLAPAVISGIGFIGAGLVLFQAQEHRLTGLTTAAGLWVSAGVGMACGYGLFSLAIIATIAALIVFTFFWFIEKLLKKFSYGGYYRNNEDNK